MDGAQVEVQVMTFVYMHTDGRIGRRVPFGIICGALHVSADEVWEANANLVLAGFASHGDGQVSLTERGVQEAATSLGVFAHHLH
jgi:hypothetical protein